MEALRAFLFGVTVAAPVGPIALLLIHTGLNHRLAAALAGALGVALADFTYALVALSAGAGTAELLHGHQRDCQLASSILLAVLGLWLTQQRRARRRPRQTPAEHRREIPGCPFLPAHTANPLTIRCSWVLRPDGGLRKCGRCCMERCSCSGALRLQVVTVSKWRCSAIDAPATVRAFNATSGLIIAAFGLYGLSLAPP